MFEIVGRWDEETRSWSLAYKINGGEVQSDIVLDVDVIKRIEQVIEMTEG